MGTDGDSGIWNRFPGGRPDWAMAPFGIFRDPQFRRHGRWILLSILVGLVSGVGAILFDLLFRLAQQLLLGGIGGFGPPGPGLEGGIVFGPAEPWRLVACVVLGGLASLPARLRERFRRRYTDHVDDAVAAATDSSAVVT